MILRFAHAWLAVAILALTACSGGSHSDNPGHDNGKIGAVRVALSGKGPDGITYRLREGHFAISGASTANINTEDAPDAEVREQALVAGDYAITLVAGWFLEGRAADGTWAKVKAKLVSPNPVAFAIQSALTTDVRFVFRVGKVEVPLEPGKVHVSIGIELEDAGVDAGHGGEQPLHKFDVLTRGYNALRTNTSMNETVLNTANVRAATFGKLFELPVDDQVYAQILYVSELGIAGAVHNVIYVATVNNTVYAFDADVAGAPLWSRSFNGAGRPTRNTEVGQNCQPYRDFSGNIGIVGTPVIDRDKHTMYFVTRTVEGNVTRQRLRSIDIVSGEDTGPGSVVIDAVIEAAGAGSINGKLFFNPVIQNQRLALGLSQGHLYVGWSGFCDTGDYHGWVMSYDANTLAQKGVFNATPSGWAGGIWQAGAGPVFDSAGNVYLGTGNGDYDGAENLGESVVKLEPRTLKVLDHFAPSNWNSLNGADLDLGSAGASWLPGTDMLVLGGKEGKVYLMKSGDLGRSAPGDTQIPQSFQLVDPSVRPNATHHLHNGVAIWEGPGGLHMYAAGENDYLRGFRFDPATSVFTLPSSLRAEVLPPVGMPGAMLTISADGNKPGTGIVWATTPRAGDANQNVTPGILRAYDAETLALLWDSGSAFDDILEFAKFNNPTVTNGKVYVGSLTQRVHVFGLREPVPPPPSANLALGKPVVGSNGCANTETVEKIVDGKVYTQTGADKFKWCAFANNAFARIDLGAPTEIHRIVVHHAGQGGESIDFNSRAFQVLAGNDPAALSPVVVVADNTLSKTVHDITPVTARYVQLVVNVPTQNGNIATRIYEVEVY